MEGHIQLLYYTSHICLRFCHYHDLVFPSNPTLSGFLSFQSTQRNETALGMRWRHRPGGLLAMPGEVPTKAPPSRPDGPDDTEPQRPARSVGQCSSKPIECRISLMHLIPYLAEFSSQAHKLAIHQWYQSCSIRQNVQHRKFETKQTSSYFGIFFLWLQLVWCFSASHHLYVINKQKQVVVPAAGTLYKCWLKTLRTTREHVSYAWLKNFIGPSYRVSTMK